MDEKENTLRALKGEELLVTKWGCRFGWHVWTKYSERKTFREGVYAVTSQSRSCGYCNLSNVKILRREYA